MKYKIKFTSRFKKDLKQVKKQGKDIEKLLDIVEKLANDESLDEKYRDHSLAGNYKGTRECHIESDFLLIYEKFNETLVLTLIRTGSHSDLFK
ncbi:addiction module toxin, RelE/StbE family [Anaerococcus lactolyticus ATCC 51172]|uniref:Addiction module toxin, RelE/StbE family n=1 Tax=Anaerococcus lactolyticus ATCC 51172 TaxID=525254 RepID=C2BHP2_9FIRM|nr:type II toxin-antitoxin system YafQ family toxin [Anaerococcus lactolyticus]EEI85655.1 addiction module toxin, RelE/StbE family [Anaerococcus lactolyticus ATCC 51172]